MPNVSFTNNLKRHLSCPRVTVTAATVRQALAAVFFENPKLEGYAYDLVFRHALDIDASGSVPAFGTTTGNLWVSEDEGDHWALVNGNLPPIYGVRLDPDRS